ncbi:MAG: hypothetical protein ABI534_04840 [Chloroflexota bacterium]
MNRQLDTARADAPAWLAWLVAALAAVAAAAGLFVPNLYRDSDAWIRQAQASDLATLALAVPILGIGLWQARRGSALGRLVALGALAYLAYGYAIFAFAVATNLMTPLHYAILGLATWSIVWTLAAPGTCMAESSIGARLPRRTTGIFLLVMAALFAALWMGQIAASIASGETAAEVARLGLVANPVWALDLAFVLPAFALVGIGLMRNRASAKAAVVPVLVFAAVMGASILAIFVFDALAGAAVDPMPVVMIGVIVLTAASLLVAGVGGGRSMQLVPAPR